MNQKKVFLWKMMKCKHCQTKFKEGQLKFRVFGMLYSKDDRFCYSCYKKLSTGKGVAKK